MGGGGPIPEGAREARYEISRYSGNKYTAISTPDYASNCEAGETDDGLDIVAVCFVPSFGDKYGSAGGVFKLHAVGFDSAGQAQPSSYSGVMYGMNPVDVVNDGEVVYFGTFVCANEAGNLTCWNADTGHGAFITPDYFTGF